MGIITKTNYKFMKQKLLLIVTLAFLTLAVSAQKNQKIHKNKFEPGQKKGELFGVGFSLSDFNAPKNFGKSSNANSLAIKDMSAGVSFSYWRGLTSMIDLSAKFTGIFHNYASQFRNTVGKTEIGLEFEPTINIRPVKDENMLAPFLTVGAGVGLYTDKLGAFIPLGAGLQINASSSTYFFVQAQYKATLTPKVMPDNMFYSIGFAQNIVGD